MFATAVRYRSLTGHSGPTPQFDLSWSGLCACSRRECCRSLDRPPLPIAVGFSPSKQLLDHDFSFHHDGREGGRGKSEKGRKGA